MVEWRVRPTSFAPRVLQPCAVRVGVGEASAIPQGLVKIGVQDLEKTAVDIGEEILLRPFEAIRVEPAAVGRVQGLALVVGLPPRIIGGIRAPVEGRRHDVVAALLVGPVVASRLHDVDLSGRRPWAVRVLDRHHPDGGPKPVAFRKLGRNLHTAVLELGAFHGVDAARFGWRDDAGVARCGVGGSHAAVPIFRRAGSVLEQVDDVVLFHLFSVLESGLDD